MKVIYELCYEDFEYGIMGEYSYRTLGYFSSVKAINEFTNRELGITFAEGQQEIYITKTATISYVERKIDVGEIDEYTKEDICSARREKR